jgi:diguanylate cyclase (GGDEF)-like protein/putative nucleotidyltransferase with HDIG domain
VPAQPANPPPGPEASALAQLRGLLDVAHAVRAGGDDLRPVLEAIARAAAGSLGFAMAVLNLHRPAFDDFEVVVVHGHQDARDLLVGTTNTALDWAPLLDPRFERCGAFLIPHDEYDWGHDGVTSYVPDLAVSPHPDAWHPEDALMVPLRAADGSLLGILSLDEPLSGRRPTDAQLEVLSAVAAHAAVVVEQAQSAAESHRHRMAVEHLLRVSSQLTGRGSAEEVFDAVCRAIREALGFEKVMVFLAEGEEGRLVPRATVGWEDAELEGLPNVSLQALSGLFDPALAREGCILLPREQALPLVSAEVRGIYASTNNGQGGKAWNHHWLVVPLYDRDGQVTGAIWADEPIDLLLPTTERLQALRAFANQASSALESARQLDHMRHLAEHDPLTGLRNRRDFEPRIGRWMDGGRSLALLVCDLDHFKRVNDSLGHESGDEVLRRFSEILRRCTRGSDVPTRVGGEEFAVMLPGADAKAALAVAERLRMAVREDFAAFPVPISVSVGVAVRDVELTEAPGLLRAANRALYAAKRLGRDRCVVYHAETLSLLDDLRDAGSASADQLAAAMLLAETLDLRDVSTARHSQTVGRLSELIARELGWETRSVERVRAAGVLHDIGKLGISDKILHKPGPLTEDERREIRRHPEIGARILEHAHLRDIASWVLRHHERVDGRGYPNGIAGGDIPAEARVLAVADAYEAMTADRPYRPALPRSTAEAELREGAGTQFDAAVVDALLRALRRGDGAAAGAADSAPAEQAA